MADAIPSGITRNDVLEALRDFDAGVTHEFAESIAYDLFVDGKRYPPKAIVGLAARRTAGRTLTPYDFKGGESSRCFRILRNLGFEIVLKPGEGGTDDAGIETTSSPKTVRFWWVNQNQTYNAEVPGGYLWSPKRNKNDARNQFYENMREVTPGDVIFSFRGTLIPAVGIAQSYCYDSARPTEFGAVGAKWDEQGWRVDVAFSEMVHPIRPKDHIDTIRPLLPDKYSPLQENGDGLQSVYLAELPTELGKLLIELLSQAGNTIPAPTKVDASLDRQCELLQQQEDQAEADVQKTLPDSTEKEQIVKARRGQGLFRQKVLAIETACRLTGVCNPLFLIASHIKPWSRSDNSERLDGHNGFMLSPNADSLFGRGFLSFGDDGAILISPVADKNAIAAMLPVPFPQNVGGFTAKQKEYLSFHRANIFLKAGSTA